MFPGTAGEFETCLQFLVRCCTKHNAQHHQHNQPRAVRFTEAASALNKSRLTAKAQCCAFGLKQEGVDTFADFACVDMEMLRAAGLNLIEARWVLDLPSQGAVDAPSLSGYAGSGNSAEGIRTKGIRSKRD